VSKKKHCQKSYHNFPHTRMSDMLPVSVPYRIPPPESCKYRDSRNLYTEKGLPVCNKKRGYVMRDIIHLWQHDTIALSCITGSLSTLCRGIRHCMILMFSKTDYIRILSPLSSNLPLLYAHQSSLSTHIFAIFPVRLEFL